MLIKQSWLLLIAGLLTTLSHAQERSMGVLSPQQSRANTDPAVLPEVVVTGNPLGSELFELATPSAVLSGTALQLQRRSTLGDTLQNLPGMSATGFGPNASRPVIRGLDGDRTHILQNGAGVIDASALSADHAVALDPLVMERAEVVRGPAALFYGGNAVGGVVNVIDNRIPQAGNQGFSGRFEARYGGPEQEQAHAVVLEGGSVEDQGAQWALHADAYTRSADDLRIKNYARSARLRAADPQSTETQYRLTNSAAAGEGGAVGVSRVWGSGYVGLSVAQFNSRYGTVAEPTVTIDMQSSRFDVAGEARELGGLVSALKWKASATNYNHQELDSGTVATVFRNKGQELQVEAQHAPWRNLKGAVGMQVAQNTLTATGDEAFLPSTQTQSQALFLFEELTLGAWKWTAGVRQQNSRISSGGGGEIPYGETSARFDPAMTRRFNGNSAALGAVWTLQPGWAVAVNGAYTERAPSQTELFANGPHAATGYYEVGNSSFGLERSRAIDIALRRKTEAYSASVSVFQNRFAGFITQYASGNTRGTDGELNPTANASGVSSNTGDDILPESVYRAVPARFRGAELEAGWRVPYSGAQIELLPQISYVQASDLSTGVPLPRIAPLRYGMGLNYRLDRLGGRVDITRVSAQHRLAASELATDGYTMLNMALTYKLPAPGARLEGFVRGVNLLNAEARNHASMLKDVAPMGGRSVQFGVRGQF